LISDFEYNYRGENNMGVPEFLVQRLYIPNSYQIFQGGFSFALQNNLIEINIHSFQLEVNNVPIPEEGVELTFGGEVPVPITPFSREKPLIFPIGQQLLLRVQGESPENGKVLVHLDTLEAGALTFHLTLVKKNLFLSSIFPFLKKLEKVPATEPLFTPDDWKRTTQLYADWFDGKLKRNLVFLDNSDAILDNHQSYINGMQCQADTFPKWWPNYGPGILAAFIGSGVESQEDTVWFTPMKHNDLSQINPVYNENAFWWKKVKEVTRKAVSRWGDWVSIAHTDLGGTLDILASLRGTEALLQDLIDDPEQVERLSTSIHGIWNQYYSEINKLVRPTGKGTSCWAACLFPGTGYFLQSDISYMISPKMFERFVLPDLELSCRELEFPFYHLDGKGQIKHLDMLLSIPNLRGIQWIPGDGAPPCDEWLPLLQRIRQAGKLVQVTVTSQGAIKIAKALGQTGFLFNIIEAMDLETEKVFLAQLNAS
jgi:hypothetical protein